MRYIKDYDPRYRGYPWPIGAIVEFTEQGARRWQPSIDLWYIANWESRSDGTYIYSVMGVKCLNQCDDNHGLAWLNHDEITPVED